jgi:ring-1,2-phenylacetyl-CoA epoxidase subunit PaaE
VVEKHHSGARQYGNQISEVQVTAAGCSTRFDLTADGENILDGAMNNGADLLFYCKGGVCATCKARLLEGEVEMDLNHAFTEKEVKDGLILTCQVYPISRKVIVDFDELEKLIQK